MCFCAIFSAIKEEVFKMFYTEDNNYPDIFLKLEHIYKETQLNPIHNKNTYLNKNRVYHVEPNPLPPNASFAAITPPNPS